MKLLDKVLEKFGIVSKEFDKKFCETFETPLDSYIKDLEKDLKESPFKIERKVGEKFEYKGTTLEVVEDTYSNYCGSCFFRDKSCDISTTGSCARGVRNDKTSVSFKLVDSNFTKQTLEGKKFDTNKLRYTLLPFKAITEVVEVLEFGARKYGKDNWQKVPDARQRYLDAGMRHWISYLEGELHDVESSKHPLAHAICCFLFIIWFDITGKKEVAK